MSIKRKILEIITGCNFDQEYFSAAREKYNETVIKLGHGNFPSNGDIIHSHVSSIYTKANVLKVKTRMLITKDFILKNINGDLSKLSFLDVGGSSGIFFNLLNIPKINGITVNVLKKHISTVIESGYLGILVGGEKLPFKNKSFDYCLSFETLEHTLSPIIHLSEMKRVTRKGVFISIPYRLKTIIANKKENSSSFNQHIFEFSPSDLESIGRYCGLSLKNYIKFNLENDSQNIIKKIYRKKMGWGKPSIFLAYFE